MADREIGPQPGPQTQFLACGADLVLYGGAAGGGKTYAMLLDWLRHANTPGANGLLVRNRDTDITIGGGLWDEACKLYQGSGVRIRAGGLKDMTWPSGAKLSFRHLDGRNRERFKGPGFSWIGVEEANECDLDDILYLGSRLRTTCGAKPVMRMTCNPDPDHALALWVEPYLHADGTADRSKSGMVLYYLRSTVTDRFVFGSTPQEAADLGSSSPDLAQTFTFISSVLADNPALDLADPSYRRKIEAMTAVEREQLGRGNWRIKVEIGGMLRFERWGIVREPLAAIVREIRGWDKGATLPRSTYRDPDYTAGPLLKWDVQGRWYVGGLALLRAEPPEVDALMASTAYLDGLNITQALEIDPAAAGKESILHARRVLKSKGKCGPIETVRAVSNKLVRAGPMARELELGMPRENDEDPWVPRGYVLDDGWLDTPYSDAGSNTAPTLGAMFWRHVRAFFTPGQHDDIVDGMSLAHAVHRRPLIKRENPAARHRRML
jgi:phage terminase large subunit-like protein